MTDAVDLEGIVEAVADGGAWAVGDLRVSGADLPAREVRRRARFVLRADDGSRVEVDSATCALEGGVPRSERGPWERVQTTPLGRLAEGFSAGPHFPVEITGAGVGPGDRVRITAQVLAHAAVEGGGYRAGHAHPSEVRALHVRGPSVREAARPAVRAVSLRDDVLRAIVAVLALALVVFALAIPGPGSVGEALTRGGWATLGLLTLFHLSARLVGYPGWSRSGLTFRHVPSFLPLLAPGAPALSLSRGLPLSTLFLLFGSVASPFVAVIASEIGDPPPRHDERGIALFIGATVAWLAVLGLALERYFGERAAHRLLGALRRAPARRAQEDGFRRVAAIAPSALAASVVLAIRHVGSGRSASSATDVIPEDLPPPELVVNAGGAPLALRPPGALFASARASTRAEGTLRAHVVLEVPAGSPLAIAAVFAPGPGPAESRGPESLLVLATPGGTAGGLYVRAALARAVALVIPLAGLVLTIVWAALTSST